jgi:hypothetical protein
MIFENISYHPNVFTSTLFLLEVRTGVAWEPSNRVTLFHLSHEFLSVSLHLISCLSLSRFSLKGLRSQRIKVEKEGYIQPTFKTRFHISGPVHCATLEILGEGCHGSLGALVIQHCRTAHH